MLLKAMVDRLKNDSKLASALGIEVSPMRSPQKHNTKTSETSLSGTTVHGTSTTRIRSNTATRMRMNIAQTAEQCTPSSTPFQTPSGTPMSTESGSPLKGTKLILAQNNPHLKSHRRRQSAFVVGEKAYGHDVPTALEEKKLPGYVERGMEQQGLLADILYGQWMQGLRSRWAVA
jgi:serine/threonine-protein kinase 24/25/MST4